MVSAEESGSTDSTFVRAVINVQIVYVDYYLCAPAELSDDEQFLSVLRKSNRFGYTKVPVVRIFGSTPAGQKCCVHLHGALPYFYVQVPHSVRNCRYSHNEGDEMLPTFYKPCFGFVCVSISRRERSLPTG